MDEEYLQPPRSCLASKHAVKFTLSFLKWRPKLHVKLVVKFAVKFAVKFWSTDFPEKSGSGLKPSFCKGNRMFLHAVLDPEFWGVFDTNKNFTQTSQQTSQHTSRTTSHATSQRIRMLNFIFPMPGSLQGREGGVPGSTGTSAAACFWIGVVFWFRFFPPAPVSDALVLARAAPAALDLQAVRSDGARAPSLRTARYIPRCRPVAAYSRVV